MQRRRRFLVGLVAGITLAGGVASAAITPFGQDVNASIDLGLQYAKNQGWFSNSSNQATGLLLLALLEKRSSADFEAGIVGYSGLGADQAVADAAAKILTDGGYFAGRSYQYAYTDGQALMALSVYGTTGGPATPPGAARSVRAAIDLMVDRLLTNQTKSGSSSGYWGYTSGGSDSSTTQFCVAGLSAAKSYYLSQGDPGGRVAGIDAALARTAAGYELNARTSSGGVFTDCGSVGCKGHGYQVNYTPSYQQTASGTWGQLLGGKNLNSPMVQSYLRWLYNAYNFQSNPSFNNGFPQFYMYYMWSSSKAYTLLEDSGVSADAGNIDTADLGSLPAAGERLARRDPLTDPRTPSWRGATVGFYSAEQPRWYYDYAYRVMSSQLADGRFPCPNGCWGEASADEADHAFALLVLERSIGGACADTDGDGICDADDNCPAVANADQLDTDGDQVGNVCDNCPSVANRDQADANQNGIGDACENRCDLDHDGDVDRNDVNLITAARGQRVPPASSTLDIDGDKLITVNDARACVLKCTRPSCALQ